MFKFCWKTINIIVQTKCAQISTSLHVLPKFTYRFVSCCLEFNISLYLNFQKTMVFGKDSHDGISCSALCVCVFVLLTNYTWITKSYIQGRKLRKKVVQSCFLLSELCGKLLLVNPICGIFWTVKTKIKIGSCWRSEGKNLYFHRLKIWINETQHIKVGLWETKVSREEKCRRHKVHQNKTPDIMIMSL